MWRWREALARRSCFYDLRLVATVDDEVLRERIEELCGRAAILVRTFRDQQIHAREFKKQAAKLVRTAGKVIAGRASGLFADYGEGTSSARSVAWSVVEVVVSSPACFHLVMTQFAVEFLAVAAPYLLYPLIRHDELFQVRNLDADALRHFFVEGYIASAGSGVAEVLELVGSYARDHPSRKHVRVVAAALEATDTERKLIREYAQSLTGDELEYRAEALGYLAAMPELRSFLVADLEGLSAPVVYNALTIKVATVGNIRDGDDDDALRWFCARVPAPGVRAPGAKRERAVFEKLDYFIRGGTYYTAANPDMVERLAACVEKKLPVETLTGYALTEICAVLDRTLRRHRRLVAEMGDEHLTPLAIIVELLLSAYSTEYPLDRRTIEGIYRATVPWMFRTVFEDCTFTRSWDVLNISALAGVGVINRYCAEIVNTMVYGSRPVPEYATAHGTADSWHMRCVRKCFALCDKQISNRLLGQLRTILLGLENIPELVFETV